MRRSALRAWLATIVGVLALQSIVHLAVVLAHDRVGSPVDLDRSNGIPDLVSTLALGCAAGGAAAIARNERSGSRRVPAALAAVLAALTLADLLHHGPHPASGTGWLVIAMVASAGALLAGVATTSESRVRVALALGGCLMVGSFLVNGLDEFDQWFERKRGDEIAEYQIVVKEGLELTGWGLVALALWDEALRRRARGTVGTHPDP